MNADSVRRLQTDIKVQLAVLIGREDDVPGRDIGFNIEIKNTVLLAPGP
jgi:hypothetical protein